MARSRSGYYNAIEYIGPRPQKPKKPNFFGGWVIVAMTLGAGFFFAKPWIGSLMAAQNGPTSEQVELVIRELEHTGEIGDQLASEALKYSSKSITYDPAYYKIGYPNGDVPLSKGVAADLVVRCYREIGIDLQEKIHEDMESDYRSYPQLWTSSEPDSNIDHRRVPNLQAFFSRYGETVQPDKARDPSTYKPGDIVVWALANAETHIGIVVPGPSGEGSTPWVVHHPAGGGVKWEPSVFSHQILGHFRYPADEE
ncbi:DUF1287 domain-containing protein [Luteolibacter algae]|uniref:DUF1287 domain-containing protein n=1 Tax=Luteolibacter algae TaxID=454151 RepID=A0ABW5DB47_9BACT